MSSDDNVHQVKKKYLQGGSGWLNQQQLARNGKKYVPKGGYIVDFAARKTPMRRKHTSKPFFTVHGVHTEKGGDHDGGEQHHKEPSIPASASIKTISNWKPPGISSTSSNSTSATAFVQDPGTMAQLRPRKPASFSRTMKSLPQKKIISASVMPKRDPPTAHSFKHSCETCKCCKDLRESLQNELDEVKSERNTAHLRRRLEEDRVKLSKTQKEFEEHKKIEMEKIQKASEEAIRKQYRDRLAEGARHRAAEKAALTVERLEIERLQKELENERNEFGKAEGRHKLELERLRRRLARFERQIADMKESLAAEEKAKITAIYELERNKKSLERFRVTSSGEKQSAPSPALSESSEETVKGVDNASVAPLQSSSNSQSSRNVLPHRCCARGPPHETVRYPNGATMHTWNDGTQVTLFENGDVKQVLPLSQQLASNNSAVVTEYHYKLVDVWHVSHHNGVETFYFPDGRVDTQFPDGSKESLLPGGWQAERVAAHASDLNNNNDTHGVSVPVSTLSEETMRPKPVKLSINS